MNDEMIRDALYLAAGLWLGFGFGIYNSWFHHGDLLQRGATAILWPFIWLSGRAAAGRCGMSGYIATEDLDSAVAGKVVKGLPPPCVGRSIGTVEPCCQCRQLTPYWCPDCAVPLCLQESCDFPHEAGCPPKIRAPRKGGGE